MSHEWLAGLFAATASIFGKLALVDISEKTTAALRRPNLSFWLEDVLTAVSCSDPSDFNEAWNWCALLVATFRIACFATMVILNILQLSSFLKALERKGSLVVTVVSSSINFIVTGILGSVVLNENVSPKWLLGATFIAVGVGLVAFSQAGGGSAARRDIS